ncbi:MAG: hypothetical protein J0I12_22000 [Candidatus Eremiobacteraeota bacterium]|nr:hypothetical protein [Candidatus Eremiobacteraeota bacterium]
MHRYPLGLRVWLAQVLGSLLLCAGVLFGPADNLARALAVGACASSLASATAGFRYPGWPWFSAGLACSLAGLLRQHYQLDDWPWQLSLATSSLVAYVVVWPIAQGTLIHVFNVETQDYESPPGSSQSSFLSGLNVTLYSAIATPVLMLLLGTSAFWFAGLGWLFLAIWLTHAYPGTRPEWNLLGNLSGLALLSNLSGTPLLPLAQPCLLTLDSFWLVGQTAVWTSLGVWCAHWHHGYLQSARAQQI